MASAGGGRKALDGEGLWRQRGMDDNSSYVPWLSRVHRYARQDEMRASRRGNAPVSHELNRGPLESAMIRCFSGPFQRACRIPHLRAARIRKRHRSGSARRATGGGEHTRRRYLTAICPSSTQFQILAGGGRERGEDESRDEEAIQAGTKGNVPRPGLLGPDALPVKRQLRAAGSTATGHTIARMHDHRHPWTSCRDWPIIVPAGRSDPEDHSPDHLGMPGHLGNPRLKRADASFPAMQARMQRGLHLAGRSYPEREPDNDRLDRARSRAPRQPCGES